jgi:hypothetical protein
MIFNAFTRPTLVLAAVVYVAPALTFGQLQRLRCEARSDDFKEYAASATQAVCVPQRPPLSRDLLAEREPLAERVPREARHLAADDFDSKSSAAMARQPEKLGFHWGRALTESFTFLLIEQAYVVHTDFRWVVSQNGIPFNHYWRDYTQSLSQWTHSGWNDGDPNWYGYIGHPIQGALTGFIQIQNDPKSEKLRFSKTKAYWKSRLRAALWNSAYSMQWNVGPLSEVTVEKYGAKDRAPWNQNGSFPCNTKHCYTGVGQIDIVMTPLGGTGWLIGEDFLDEKVVRRVEEATHSRVRIDAVRVALNPLRAGANMLHGEHPWYRASRDGQGVLALTEQRSAISTDEIPAPVRNHGSFFVGYSHAGGSHCEVVASGATTVCDPLSAKSSNLGGWNVGVEKMYLRYFSAVADISGQYGGVRQDNFLFGLRGGAGIGRFRPYAQVLIGAVRVRENASAISASFAEDLGLGLDFRLIRRLSWRNQVDELKTGTPDFQRRNLHLSSGLAVRF